MVVYTYNASRPQASHHKFEVSLEYEVRPSVRKEEGGQKGDRVISGRHFSGIPQPA